MATIVADADVLLHADASLLPAEIKSKLAAFGKNLKEKFTVQVDVDDSSIKPAVEKIRKKLSATKATIGLDIDEKTVRTFARDKLGRFTSGLKAKVPLTPEVDSAGLGSKIFARIKAIAQRGAGVFKKTFSQGLSNLGSSLGGLATSLGGGLLSIALKGALVFPTLAGGITAVAQTILVLLPLLGALPGAILALAAPVGVIVLGFRGFGEALGGDTAALNKLAPSARQVVKVLRSFGPAFSQIRKSVQQKLFDKLAGPIKNLVSSELPNLRTALDSIATSVNGGLAKALGVLNSQEGKIRIGEIFSNTSAAVKTLADSISGPLTRAFLAVTAAGARLFNSIAPGLAKKIENLSNKITDFANNGGLERAFKRAKEFAEDLYTAVKRVVDIVKSVGKSFLEGLTGQKLGEGNAESSIDKVNLALNRLKKVVDDENFKEAMRGLGFGVAALAGSFLLLGIALGKAFSALEKFAKLYKSVKEFLFGKQEGQRSGHIDFTNALGIGEGSGSSLEGAISALNRLNTAMKLVSLTASGFGVSLSAGFGTARNAVTIFVNAVTSQMQALPGRVTGALAPIGGVISRQFESGFSQARSVVGVGISGIVSLMAGVKNRVVSAVGDLSGSLVSAGRQLVQGFANGINLASKIASAAARQMALNASNAAGGALGIHSPSRVFFELGVFTIRGFILGLLKLRRQLAATTASVAGSVAQNFPTSLPVRGRKIGAGLNIPAFGDGGVVDRPTVALVGEKGPEMITPLRGASSSTTTITKTSAPTINVTSSSVDPMVIVGKIFRRLQAA